MLHNYFNIAAGCYICLCLYDNLDIIFVFSDLELVEFGISHVYLINYWLILVESNIFKMAAGHHLVIANIIISISNSYLATWN